MKVVLRKSEAASPFSFVFVNSEGKTVLKSENYKQKASALNGIESVRKNCITDARYEFKTAKNGKFFFNIKSTNGQIVATSSFFDSEADKKKAIDDVKKNAPKAKLQE